jgi:hypothetical protein
MIAAALIARARDVDPVATAERIHAAPTTTEGFGA